MSVGVRVGLTRSEGFLRLRRALPAVDTEELSADEGAEPRGALAREARLEAERPNVRGPCRPAVPTASAMSLTMEEGGRERSVSFSEQEVAPEPRALVTWLQAKGRSSG